MGEGRCLGADPIILVDHAARRHSGVEGAFSAYGPKLKSEGKPEAGNKTCFKIIGNQALNLEAIRVMLQPPEVNTASFSLQFLENQIY